MAIDFVRMAVVYLHLIACCVAIGLVLTNDITIVKLLLKVDPTERIDPLQMSVLQKTVAHALIALWITGAGIVAIDVAMKDLTYFGNPKLQAKLTIVCLLTLNGAVLQRYVFPVLVSAGSILKLPEKQRKLVILAGAMSGVSWFYAAMLGVSRPLNWNYSLFELLAAYPVFIACGFASMLLLTTNAMKSTTHISSDTDGNDEISKRVFSSNPDTNTTID
jgi:hypothetical protein